MDQLTLSPSQEAMTQASPEYTVALAAHQAADDKHSKSNLHEQISHHTGEKKTRAWERLRDVVTGMLNGS